MKPRTEFVHRSNTGFPTQALGLCAQDRRMIFALARNNGVVFGYRRLAEAMGKADSCVSYPLMIARLSNMGYVRTRIFVRNRWKPTEQELLGIYLTDEGKRLAEFLAENHAWEGGQGKS